MAFKKRDDIKPDLGEISRNIMDSELSVTSEDIGGPEPSAEDEFYDSDYTPEIVTTSQRQRFSLDTLASLQSYDDVLALARENNEEVLSSDTELGHGFINTDKERLIGVPFIIVDWTIHQGTKGQGLFVSVFVMANRMVHEHGDGKKVLFNDGGTGICADLIAYQKKHGKTTFIECPRGLTPSDYQKTNELTGEIYQARTFYIG